MHILFVDDVEDTRALFAYAFGGERHTTQLACDGTEAIALVEQERFDAIVMDVEMAPLNGIEATRRIRQLPHGQQIPIIVLTSHTDKDYRHEALEAGANGVIYKPILPQVVLTRLEDFKPHTKSPDDKSSETT